jgi:hypothetical protein
VARSLVPPPLTDADKADYTDAVRAETQWPEQRLDIQYVPADTNCRASRRGLIADRSISMRRSGVVHGYSKT